MARERKNIGASVRARLLDQARAKKTDFRILLTRYALERLLYRLSVSEYRDRFILKGAMLFSTWVVDPFRPTRDLDLLGSGDNDADALKKAFSEICAMEVEADGVEFDVNALTVKSIREELKYGGVRVQTTATIDKASIAIQVDIGFGDAVTPAAKEIEFPVLLDSPAPRLRAYPPETVVAEKFEALVTLGITNSRLKDFYDMWMISRTFEFHADVLAEAVRRTFERRSTPLPKETPVGLTDDYAKQWAGQWSAFIGRERMAAVPTELAVVVTDLRNFLMPIVVPK